jgi:hypothetical protein
MRAFPALMAIALPFLAMGQADTAIARPLILQDAFGLQLSKARIFQAALAAWTYTFGLEPGARIELQDARNGLLEGTARVNYRNTGLTAREETMGVIAYRVTIQAENGQCRVHIAQFSHSGNRNAAGGGIDIGTLYLGDRPMERIRGISIGTAMKLHADMRDQAIAQVRKVMNAFAARMRTIAASTK